MRHRSGAGFTLMEAIIVIALVGVVFVMLSQFFLGGNQTYRLQKAELDVNYSARVGLDDIDSYVRQASQTTAAYGSYVAGPDVLILQIPSLSPSNQIIPTSVDHVVYYLDGTRVMREIFPDAASVRTGGLRMVAEDVVSLTFTLDNADHAQVTQVETAMGISQNTGREIKNFDITSKSRLRN